MGFYHDLKMSTAYKKDKKLPQVSFSVLYDL
jgi:hypothetical protein